MNQIATQPQLGSQVAMTNSAGGFAVTPQTLSDVVEFAKFMCMSNAGIPAFLRGNAPDCAAVIMQAMKWGFDPFSVAQKSYKVKDIIAYEAQLIAAVINARSGIKGRMRYQFDGEGDDLTCTVTGSLDGEDCSYTSPRVGRITTKNSPLWKTDPQQQLGYYSARNWVRRHCPEVLLGAYDRDEAEEFRGPDRAKDITPAFDPLSDEPPAVTYTNQEPSDEVPASDAGSGAADPSTGPAADQTAREGEAEEGAAEAAHGEQAAPSSGPINPLTRMIMEECIDNMLRDAFSEPAIERQAKVDKLRDVFLLPENLGDYAAFVTLCHETTRRIIGKPEEKSRAREYLIGRVP